MDRVLKLKPPQEVQKRLRSLLVEDEEVQKAIYEQIGRAVVEMMDTDDRTSILEDIMSVYYSVAVMCYDKRDASKCLNRMTQDVLEMRFHYVALPKKSTTVDYVEMPDWGTDLGSLGEKLKDMAEKIGAIQQLLQLLVVLGTYQTIEDAFEHFADETNMREGLSDEAYDEMRRRIVDE